MNMFAVVTGGGTAGHVLPALAVAEALEAAGHDRGTIRYVGTRRGIETSLVPPSGLPCTFLDVVGLQRRLTARNLSFPWKLWRSVREARRLLRAERPKVVVNLGGYGSFPATWAARREGIPYVVVSFDRKPGLVSRVLAGRAAACAVAFEATSLPHAVHTGAPVRRELVTLHRRERRDAAREALGIPADRFLLAVVCGSLGAAAVNRVVDELVEGWAERRDLAVFHVVGDRFLAAAAPARSGEHGILYRVVGYEQRMADLYAAADLLLTRAGAGTIAEVATVGVPAVVVPWPGAADNHQVDNARVLSDRGAAVLIEQHELTVERLAAEVSRLVDHPEALDELGAAARTAGSVHRSGRLVDVVEAVAAGERR